MPNDRSRVRSALPVILPISLLRNELRAEFMEKLPVPSARYMPVVSMVTANFPRWSTPMACSSLCSCMSSGASSVNSRPMSLSVLVILTPQSKSTLRPTPLLLETVALVRSVAVMFSVGFMGSPVNSMYEPSLMVNVFSGMTGSEYFISPLDRVYRPRSCRLSVGVYCMRSVPPPMRSI